MSQVASLILLATVSAIATNSVKSWNLRRSRWLNCLQRFLATALRRFAVLTALVPVLKTLTATSPDLWHSRAFNSNFGQRLKPKSSLKSLGTFLKHCVGMPSLSPACQSLLPAFKAQLSNLHTVTYCCLRGSAGMHPLCKPDTGIYTYHSSSPSSTSIKVPVRWCHKQLRAPV